MYAPTDLNDGMLTHYLRTSDTLRAHLVHNGTLNILQCGAFGDGVNDDFTFITKALKKGFPLFFPKRTYKVSGPLRGVICLYSVYKFLTLGPFYNGYGVDPFYIWYSYPWYNNLLG